MSRATVGGEGMKFPECMHVHVLHVFEVDSVQGQPGTRRGLHELQFLLHQDNKYNNSSCEQHIATSHFRCMGY